MDDDVQDSIPTAGSAIDADPKWREAGVNWARRAPEGEVERLSGNRSDLRDGVELRILRADQPSLFTELTAELHRMGDDPELSLRVEPWFRAFVGGATSVWDETHG